MGRGVFLDRDGVINANVLYPDTGKMEAPRKAEDFSILPGALEAMARLQDAGYLLFVVSNQPNQAKRKATAADHDAIQAKLRQHVDRNPVSKGLVAQPARCRRGLIQLSENANEPERDDGQRHHYLDERKAVPAGHGISDHREPFLRYRFLPH